MTRKHSKSNTKAESMVYFITENDVIDFVGEASASLLLSPAVVWAKFVLTDDLPNGNKARIPVEEFDNVINTALHTPVKMAEGMISEGHDGAKPIGTIAHLKKELTEAGNRIIALAALWNKERPEDIELIREAMSSPEGVNVSWELSFGDVEASEGGAVAYRDVTMNAATIVARPAYQGRTRFLALAAKAKDWSNAFIESLPDSSFLYIDEGGKEDSEGNTLPKMRYFPIKDATGLIDEERLAEAMKETVQVKLPEPILMGVRDTIKGYRAQLDAGASLEEISGLNVEGEPSENNIAEETNLDMENLDELKAQIRELETKLEEANAKLAEHESANLEATEALASLKAAKAELEEVKETLETEVTELREFKSEIESKEAEATKLADIKARFEEAGINKEEEYFASNKEMLLALGESELDFMVKELTEFAKEAEATLKRDGIRVPNLSNREATSASVREIVAALKERKAK